MSRAKKYYGKNHKWVKRTRLELVMAQGNRCHWCKEHMTIPRSGTGSCLPTDATLDHVIPLADGGSRKPHNLVAACAKCNNSRPTKKSQRDMEIQQAEALARRASKA